MNDRDIILDQLVISGKNRVEFEMGGSVYQMVKLPAMDRTMIMPKLAVKVTKSILPFVKPLLAIYSEMAGQEGKGLSDMLKGDVSLLLESDKLDTALEKIAELDEESILYIFDIATKVTMELGDKKAIDMDKLLEENPQSYLLLIYHFIKIQVMPLFLGLGTPKEEEQQLKVI